MDLFGKPKELCFYQKKISKSGLLYPLQFFIWHSKVSTAKVNTFFFSRYPQVKFKSFFGTFWQSKGTLLLSEKNIEIWSSLPSSVFYLAFKNFDRKSQFFFFLEISSSKIQVVFWNFLAKQRNFAFIRKKYRNLVFSTLFSFLFGIQKFWPEKSILFLSRDILK